MANRVSVPDMALKYDGKSVRETQNVPGSRLVTDLSQLSISAPATQTFHGR